MYLAQIAKGYAGTPKRDACCNECHDSQLLGLIRSYDAHPENLATRYVDEAKFIKQREGACDGKFGHLG